MESNYSVQIEDFAERYFIKSFKKKYGSKWDVTLNAIIFQLERIDNLILTTNKATTIIDGEELKQSLKLQAPKSQQKHQAIGAL